MTDRSSKDAIPSPSHTASSAEQLSGASQTHVSNAIKAFLYSGVMLLLWILSANRLSRYGFSQQFYFLLLLFSGIACALVLFGILHSTATWNGKILGGNLRLGGSAVCVGLVVFGGYLFTPKATSFPLTIYVHGNGGSQDIVLRKYR